MFRGFTSFTRDDQMLANELIHQIEMPVSNVFATMIAQEIGAPSFRSRYGCSWYVRAHVQTSAGYPHPDARNSIPFCLRWDSNGNATVVVSFLRIEELEVAFRHIVTGVEIVELPRGRNARAA